jgi:hypothetical protein
VIGDASRPSLEFALLLGEAGSRADSRLVAVPRRNGVRRWSGRPLHVYVECSSDDLVGQRLCYEIKEQIRDSVEFKLVDSPKALAFIIHLVSIDQASGDEEQGASSAVAIVFTIERADDQTESYLTDFVQILGANRVHEVAEGVISNLDNESAP